MNRVIYIAEVYTITGDLMVRRFFATKQAARRIVNLYQRQDKGYDVVLRKLSPGEMVWVRTADIE